MTNTELQKFLKTVSGNLEIKMWDSKKERYIDCDVAITCIWKGLPADGDTNSVVIIPQNTIKKSNENSTNLVNK